MSDIVRKFKNTIKKNLDNLCLRLRDPLLNFSLHIKMRKFSLPSFISREQVENIGRFISDLACLIDDMREKPVWQMTGSGLRIVFVGTKISSLEILPQFFDDSPAHECIGHTWALGLSRKTQKWLDEGCDLVIYELSRLHWFRSPATVAFSVPRWISQAIPYPEQINKMLSGNRHGSLRQHINRARKAGYSWRFSKSRAEYDFFYERMYVPFVRARHGELAQINPYPFHWDLFVKGAGANGGLVLVTDSEKMIAGAIGRVTDGVCYNVEVGVVDADSELLQQGLNAYLFWTVAEWGKERGATLYNMGGSLGCRSNGTFRWKAKWGAQVIRHKYTTRVLTFSADRILPPLLNRVNEIGFVCEKDDLYYGLMLDTGNALPNDDDLQEAIKRAKTDGLSGVCMVGPGAQRQYYG